MRYPFTWQSGNDSESWYTMCEQRYCDNNRSGTSRSYGSVLVQDSGRVSMTLGVDSISYTGGTILSDDIIEVLYHSMKARQAAQRLKPKPEPKRISRL